MTENNQPITTLHNLLDYEALQFTSAEVQLRECVPGWINKAGSLKLKAILQKYLDLTMQHIQKMERFLEEEKIDSLNLGNRVMRAFIEETEQKLSNCTDTAVKDACILSCVQAINHFKISTYGTAAAFANTLNMEKHASVFHEAEINEKQIDDRLSQLAEHEINSRAKSPVVLPG